VEIFSFSGFRRGFLGREGAELQRMNPAGKFLGQDGVDAALPGDAVFAGKALSDDLDPEMRFFAGVGAGVMPRMQVGIIVDFQPRRLQGGFQFLANSLRGRHAQIPSLLGRVSRQKVPLSSGLSSYPRGLSPFHPAPILS
jgi:hypothetical protein